MSLLTPLAAILPMAPCIPQNNTLSGPLSPVINQIAGAVGGLIEGLVILMAVIAAALALIFILTRNGATWLRTFGMVLALGLAIPLVILIYQTIRVVFQNAC